jgi:hypothetical protein
MFVNGSGQIVQSLAGMKTKIMNLVASWAPEI